MGSELFISYRMGGISYRMGGRPFSCLLPAVGGGKRAVPSLSLAPAPGGLGPQALGILRGSHPHLIYPLLGPLPLMALLSFQRRDLCHRLKTSRAPESLTVDPKLLPPWGFPHWPNWSWRPRLVPILGSQQIADEVSLGALPADPPFQGSCAQPDISRARAGPG